MKARERTEREQEEVVIPEYPLFNPQEEQRVRQDHERPVETGEPEADATVELRYRRAPTRRYGRDEALARIDEALRRISADHDPSTGRWTRASIAVIISNCSK